MELVGTVACVVFDRLRMAGRLPALARTKDVSCTSPEVVRLLLVVQGVRAMVVEDLMVSATGGGADPLRIAVTSWIDAKPELHCGLLGSSNVLGKMAEGLVTEGREAVAFASESETEVARVFDAGFWAWIGLGMETAPDEVALGAKEVTVLSGTCTDSLVCTDGNVGACGIPAVVVAAPAPPETN